MRRIRNDDMYFDDEVICCIVSNMLGGFEGCLGGGLVFDCV